MSLFKRFKDWFNGGDDSQDEILVLKNPLKTKKDSTVETVVKTETLTVKPKKPTTQKPKNRETRKSLDKMTKVQIDDLAVERFGIDLDRRKTKADMIEQFMAAQRKAK